MADGGLADRLKEARLRAAVRQRETVSQDGMAQLIAGVLGRPFHLNQWRRYETGEREAPLDVIRAAAEVSGLTAGYIAFGTVTPPPGVEELDLPSPKPAGKRKGA